MEPVDVTRSVAKAQCEALSLQPLEHGNETIDKAVGPPWSPEQE
jgi:hypothetical protein